MTLLGTSKSYLNLANLEKGSRLPNTARSEECLAVLAGPDGLRSVEGSEATECSVPSSAGEQKLKFNHSSVPVQEER